MTVLLVAVAAGVASTLRYLASQYADGDLPWGTVTVNLLGSFTLGLVAGLPLPDDVTTVLVTGFCGGLTTYSAFAVQTHDRGVRRGTLVVVLTLPPALALCALGHAAGGLA